MRNSSQNWKMNNKRHNKNEENLKTVVLWMFLLIDYTIHDHLFFLTYFILLPLSYDLGFSGTVLFSWLFEGDCFFTSAF